MKPVSNGRRAFNQSLLALPAVSTKLHAVGHRIETSVFHPWVVGFRRHPFMRDFWKYIDIDPEGRGGSAA